MQARYEVSNTWSIQQRGGRLLKKAKNYKAVGDSTAKGGETLLSWIS